MKGLTSTVVLCVGVLGVAAAHAADTTSYKRDAYGDWRVVNGTGDSETRAQVQADLAQAKATGQYTFGEEDYPAAIPEKRIESRAQVASELRAAQSEGMMKSDNEDYPPHTQDGE